MFFKALLHLTALAYAQVCHAWEVRRDLISDTERETWQITDEQLKDLVWKCTDKAIQDRRPTHVYVKDAYEYKKYNRAITEVHRVIKSVNQTIQVIYNKQMIFLTDYHFNNKNYSYPVSVHEADNMREIVGDVMVVSWYTEGKLTVTGSMRYWFFLRPLQGPDFSYFGPWGGSATVMKPVTVGPEYGEKIWLQPGEHFVVHLTGNKGATIVRIDYEAYLSGDYVAVYGNLRDPTQLVYGDINSCLEKLKMPTVMHSYIELKCNTWSDVRIAVSKNWALNPVKNLHRIVNFTSV